MIMRVGHGSQMRNSSVGVKSNQNSSGKAVRKQTQNQNGPYMKVNDAKSNATSDTMYQVTSNQTQSTAYSIRTTSSGAQKGKFNSHYKESPNVDGSSNQNFGRKRSTNPTNSNRVIQEPIEEDDEGSGIVNSLELGITGQGAGFGQGQRNMRIQSPSNSSSTHVQGPNTAHSAKVQRKGFTKASE